MNKHFPSDEWQYCPWCGEKSFRAARENYMQCDRCLKKFYINASGAVACIIENPQGEILLTRRAFEPAKGMLDLPGGFVSLDETAENAVRREVKEELNLDVVSLRYIGSSPNHYLYGGMLYFTLDLGFKCLVTDFSAMRVADDVNGYEFLPHHRIDLQEICFPSIRSILKNYLLDNSGQQEVYRVLDELGITFEYHEHPPTPTVEDARKYWTDSETTYCKNLFFRNHKGNRHYLVILECSQDLNIYELEKRLKQGKISFASEQRMQKYLGVQPGSVSPFGLINDKEHHVHVFFDRQLQQARKISFHPNDNRISLIISAAGFWKYMDWTKNGYEFI